MTDEWPFIDQRIPDRSVVFAKVDPSRSFEVIEDEDEDFEDLGFSFGETAEEKPKPEAPDDRLTRNQMRIYELVNGRDSVDELILESPLIEFDTCKALADLVDRRIIREASPEEVARQLSREAIASTPEARRTKRFSWVSIPLIVVLLVSLAMVPTNAANPIVRFRSEIWDGLVLKSLSWLWMVRLSRSAEVFFMLRGLYPESVADLLDTGYSTEVNDPWGRPYRLSTREGRLIVTGTDSRGEPAAELTISRELAMEPDEAVMGSRLRPGVRLLP